MTASKDLLISVFSYLKSDFCFLITGHLFYGQIHSRPPGGHHLTATPPPSSEEEGFFIFYSYLYPLLDPYRSLRSGMASHRFLCVISFLQKSFACHRSTTLHSRMTASRDLLLSDICFLTSIFCLLPTAYYFLPLYKVSRHTSIPHFSFLIPHFKFLILSFFIFMLSLIFQIYAKKPSFKLKLLNKYCKMSIYKSRTFKL